MTDQLALVGPGQPTAAPADDASPLRDRARNRRFVEAAARGHQPFVEQASARLDAGDERFGDSWAWIGARRHLAELQEEAADLGSWAALADQALDREHGLTDNERAQLRDVLQRVAALGCEAHRILDGAAGAIGAQS